MWAEYTAALQNLPSYVILCVTVTDDIDISDSVHSSSKSSSDSPCVEFCLPVSKKHSLYLFNLKGLWLYCICFQALFSYVVECGYPAEQFELVTTFPRRNISQLDPTQTLRQCSLYPQDTVFIQERCL